MTYPIRMFAASLLFAASSMATAHDPAEHAKEATEAGKAADCSALEHSTMDPADPVARALMAKCGMAADGHAPSATQTPAPEPVPVPRATDAHGDHR